MGHRRAIDLLVAAVATVGVCGAVAAQAPTSRIPSVDDRVLIAIQEARAQAGSGPLERRAALDAVAQDRAERVAGLPDRRRLSDPWLLDRALEQGGVVGWARAFQRMSVVTGTRFAERITEQWRALPESWDHAMDARTRGVGLAGAYGPDGAYVFVAVLIEDLGLPSDPAILERRLFEAINEVRREHGLDELIAEPALDRVARAYSEAMRDGDFFDHVGPDGGRAADRVAAAGLSFRRIAENLGLVRRVRDPVARAVRNWMDSQGHRANILDPVYRHTGIGAAVSPRGEVWFTQLFAEGLVGAPRAEGAGGGGG